MTTDTEINPSTGAVVIAGSIDPSTGSIETNRDVIVQGDVTDSHKVLGGANVTIQGSIDNAKVCAVGHVNIGGGAIGLGRCSCLAGGDLRVRHVNGATLEAGADITIQSNASMARIICRNQLRVGANATGGHITAAGGACFKTLGTAAGAATLVEVGIDETIRRLAAKILPTLESDLCLLEKKRIVVAPLVRNMKTLNAKDKERATELLYEIQELEERTHEALNELRPHHERLKQLSQSRVVVEDVVHPGVVIRIGAIESSISSAIRGPIAFAQRRVGNTTAIVVVEPASNTCTPLNTVPFRDAVLEQLNRILLAKGESK